MSASPQLGQRQHHLLYLHGRLLPAEHLGRPRGHLDLPHRILQALPAERCLPGQHHPFFPRPPARLLARQPLLRRADRVRRLWRRWRGRQAAMRRQRGRGLWSPEDGGGELFGRVLRFRLHWPGVPALRCGESLPCRRRRVQRVRSARRGGGNHRWHCLRPLRRVRPRGLGLQQDGMAEEALHRPPAPLCRSDRLHLRRDRPHGQDQGALWLLPDQHRLVLHLLGAAAGQVHGLDGQLGQRDLRRLVWLFPAGAVPRLRSAAPRHRPLPRRPHRLAHDRGDKSAALPLARRPGAAREAVVRGGGPRPPRFLAGSAHSHLLLRPFRQRLHLPCVVVPGLHHLSAERPPGAGLLHAAGRECQVQHRGARLHHRPRHRLHRPLARRLAGPLHVAPRRLLQASEEEDADCSDARHSLPASRVRADLLLVGGARAGAQARSDGRGAADPGGARLPPPRGGDAHLLMLRRRARRRAAVQAGRGQRASRRHKPRAPPPLPRHQLDHHLPRHRGAHQRRRC
mmetsp:Transcript_47469/g.153758  ORF Transcript_47469/g.153758 Transcript_47469/m.153758 type:complete len:513 (-) Transcript_47469:1759-3297(-)